MALESDVRSRRVGPGMTESVEFGAWLRCCRRSAGLSQEVLAERADLSVCAVRDLERGRTGAPHAGQLRLAVVAYLARFKGTCRYNTEPDLRCYLGWCTERGLDPTQANNALLRISGAPLPHADHDSSRRPTGSSGGVFTCRHGHRSSLAASGLLSLGQARRPWRGCRIRSFGAATTPRRTVARGIGDGLVWRVTCAYSEERQAAYAAPPFPAPTPPGALPVKALRARLDVVRPGHG
jgi:transcriptional regulator with XRE-family HTH domain